MAKKILLEARHQYDETTSLIEDKKTAIVCLDESLTVQDAPDADLNEIMRRFGVTDGSILPATLGITDPRYYGDFTEEAPDLRTALERMEQAEERFNQLPPLIRERFNNDPLNMLQWIENPRNLEEAVKLKLLHQDALPQPEEQPAPPIPPQT